MKTYHVVLPALTRTEEHHFIQAEDEDEAFEIALTNEPEFWVDDPDYYVIQKDSVEISEKEED
jgi:hypothetical protein